MRKDDRVGLSKASGRNLQRGTVIKASPAGYIQVKWDTGGVGYFSPAGSMKLMRLDGKEGIKRHWWTSSGLDIDEADVICRRCNAIQTDENEFESCQS